MTIGARFYILISLLIIGACVHKPDTFSMDLVHNNENVFYAPALPLEEVFDPTGAGDTFAGGFAGYIARTGDASFENMKNAVIYGSTLASFCVEKFGTERMVNLKADEVHKRLQQFKNLTQFEIELS